MLSAQEIDLGLSTLTEKTAVNLESHELLQLPMVLLVPKQSGITKVEQIFQQDRINLPLVTLDANDVLSRAFQATLRQRGVEWLESLEVGSLDLVVRYVTEGFGAGLTLKHPRVELPAALQALELKGFPPLSFGILWTGRLSPLGQIFLDEARALVAEFSPGA